MKHKRKKTTKSFYYIIFIAFHFVFNANATNWYVDNAASGSNDGKSISNTGQNSANIESYYPDGNYYNGKHVQYADYIKEVRAIGKTKIMQSMPTRIADGPGSGEHIYIAQSAQGTGSGFDTANTRSIDWLNNSENWTTTQSDSDQLIGPSDTIHLCGVISTDLTIQGSGIVGNPITIIFEPNAGLSAPYWDTHVPEPGGSKIPLLGAINISNRNYIVLDGNANGIIEATDNGTVRNYQYSFAGIHLTNCSNIEIKNLSIRNLYHRVKNSSDYNIFGMAIVYCSGSNVSIHDNLIENAYYGIMYYTSQANTENVKIYNNEVVGACIGIAAALGNNNATIDDVQIYHNHIYNCNVWDGTLAANPYDPSRTFHRKDGIKTWGRVGLDNLYSNCKIYNNVVGPGISGTQGSITAWICLDHGNYQNAEINNNILLSDQNDTYAGGGGITFNGSLPLQSHNARIYNNTMIGMGEGIVMSICRTSNIEIYNNLFYNYGAGVYMAENPDYAGEFSLWDYNCWYPENKSYRFVYQLNTYYSDREPYWSSIGFDLHSVYGDSLFVDISNPAGLDGIFFTDDDGLRLREGSPAVGAGLGGWDIGAYEYTGIDAVDKLHLHQNYPNPFNVETIFKYDLSEDLYIEISLFDIAGRKVKTFFSGVQSEGTHEETVKGDSLISGVYFFSIQGDDFKGTKKCVLVK